MTGLGVWQVNGAKEQYFSDLQSLQQEEAQDAVLKLKKDEEAAQEALYQVHLEMRSHILVSERQTERLRGRQRD